MEEEEVAMEEVAMAATLAPNTTVAATGGAQVATPGGAAANIVAHTDITCPCLAGVAGAEATAAVVLPRLRPLPRAWSGLACMAPPGETRVFRLNAHLARVETPGPGHAGGAVHASGREGEGKSMQVYVFKTNIWPDQYQVIVSRLVAFMFV